MLPAPKKARIRRVQLRNYRSIAGCDVSLGQLTFLVGPNGSGKSNFLDALRLVSDGLRTSLDHALRDRGGVAEVRQRSSGRPNHFGLRIEFELADGVKGFFAFEVGARAGGTYVIKQEQCTVGHSAYRVVEGEIETAPAPVSPPAANDRFYLGNAAGLPTFRPVFDLLSNMGFYNLNPDQIRAPQPADMGDLLARDGHNLPSVLERLGKEGGGRAKQRIEEYLAKIVPGLDSVERVRVGHLETLEFRQRVKEAEHPWKFNAFNMSDGTLRALGILAALFQAREQQRVSLVAIEEPEAALHPAAAGLLRDALREGARYVQVVVTSHSPELLDDAQIEADQIYAVVNSEGSSKIAPIDAASRSVLRDRLYTVGEMLRTNQLEIDLTAVPLPQQLQLFDPDVRPDVHK